MSKKYLSLSLALTVPMLCLSMACGGGTPEAETPEGAATPETPAVPEAPATETPATEMPAEGAAPADGTETGTETGTESGGGATPAEGVK